MAIELYLVAEKMIKYTSEYRNLVILGVPHTFFLNDVFYSLLRQF